MLKLFATTAQNSLRSAVAQTSKVSVYHSHRLTMATQPAGSIDSFKANDLFDVSHVTAVVTGGGTGIGLMISQALCQNGAKVYITGRRSEVLEQTIKAHNTGPGSLHALPGDISTKAGALQLAQDLTRQEPNGIQLLVNNAGIARDLNTMFRKNGEPNPNDPEAISQHFLRAEDAHFAETYQTNVTGQYFMSMAFLPSLARGNARTPGYRSQVVNVSSISGAMKGSSGGQFAYSSSKAAFTHVGRMLATTFKDVQVRVNVIAPGIFPSEMTTGESDEENKSQMALKAGNPAGRPGQDSDMAATILLLAGKGGLFYNEQIMYPDGGECFQIESTVLKRMLTVFIGATLIQPATN